MRYFLAVVEEGSLSAASRRLHVAQPSLSRQIRAFESDLGVTLFDRAQNRLKLNALGRRFLPLARELRHKADMAVASAHAFGGGLPGRLRLAAAPATIIDVVAPFIARSGANGVLTDVLQVRPERAYEAVTDGLADVAISTHLPPRDLSWRVVGHTSPWAQCAPGYPALTGGRPVTVEELLEWPLIVMTTDHAVRRLFDQAVAHAGLTYDPAFETVSNRVAQALAAAGRGVCITSDHDHFGLKAAPVIARGRTLTITHYAGWEPDHYAEMEIVKLFDGLGAFFETDAPV